MVPRARGGIVGQLESRLASHQARIDQAMRLAAEIEGGIVTNAPAGSVSSEIKRVIGELTNAAMKLIEQAKELQKQPEEKTKKRSKLPWECA